jgi:NADH-quinone oxidoreductase subunit F
MDAIFKRREKGIAKKTDIDLLDQTAGAMKGQTICALAEAAALPAQGMVKAFREELEQYVMVPYKK